MSPTWSVKRWYCLSVLTFIFQRYNTPLMQLTVAYYYCSQPWFPQGMWVLFKWYTEVWDSKKRAQKAALGWRSLNLSQLRKRQSCLWTTNGPTCTLSNNGGSQNSETSTCEHHHLIYKFTLLDTKLNNKMCQNKFRSRLYITNHEHASDILQPYLYLKVL